MHRYNSFSSQNGKIWCIQQSFFCLFFLNIQHPFISQAKPVTILRDLITEAMEMKAKRQQEQQRELEEEDDNSVRLLRCCSSQTNQQTAICYGSYV